MQMSSNQKPLTSQVCKWEEHGTQQWSTIPWPALQCPVAMKSI